MNKISVNILGPGEIIEGQHNYGLGNQLFQIASVLSYAKDNNFKAVFPCLRDKTRYGNYTDNILRNLIVDEDISNYVLYCNPDTKYKPIPESEKSILIHDSYLQSEKYFSSNRGLILETFSPSAEDKQYLENKYGEALNSENSISCHIRRGDYIELKDKYTPLTDSGYYDKALNTLGDGVVFVFSDDVDWCRENFKPIDRELVFVEEKDYLELYLMSMCKDNIIGNSTFSWWGAWLNNRNKRVVAPSNWFATERKDMDLIPEDWIVI